MLNVAQEYMGIVICDVWKDYVYKNEKNLRIIIGQNNVKILWWAITLDNQIEYVFFRCPVTAHPRQDPLLKKGEMEEELSKQERRVCSKARI